MNFESKSSRILATIAVGIVLYRIVTKLMPWIYKNVIVPKLFGPRIDVRKMGSWAGAYTYTFHNHIAEVWRKILPSINLNPFYCSYYRLYGWYWQGLLY